MNKTDQFTKRTNKEEIFVKTAGVIRKINNNAITF